LAIASPTLIPVIVAGIWLRALSFMAGSCGWSTAWIVLRG
jgi:hypothetical protein